MKILFVTNLCATYRIGIFELLDKMYDIEFLFYLPEKANYYDGRPLMGNFRGEYIWGFYILPKIKINPALIYKLIFGNYTHIIINFVGRFSLLATFFIAKLRRKKIILWTLMWHHHRTIFYKCAFLFIKYMYHKSDAIVAGGLHVKNFLISQGVDERKITIAWQAQDNKKFQINVTQEERNKRKLDLGIHTARLILFVGRLIEEKGVLLLLEAFRSLGDKEVSLLLIGRGPLENEFKKFMLSAKNIFYIPYVPNEQLYLYYSLAEIFVLPSITSAQFKEPWGFVVNEAMCQGCAVIVSDAVGAGAGGLIRHRENGYIVRENDPDALKDALGLLLGDETLLAQLRHNAKQTIKKWNYEEMAKGFSAALAITNR